LVEKREWGVGNGEWGVGEWGRGREGERERERLREWEIRGVQ
jgi:hypothetical protein